MPWLVKELAKDRLALIGLFTIILLVAVAVAAPILAPYDPAALDLTNRLAPPCLQHPLGTDSVGRDILSRIIFGTRVSLSVSTIVVLIELMIGLVVGTVAGNQPSASKSGADSAWPEETAFEEAAIRHRSRKVLW